MKSEDGREVVDAMLSPDLTVFVWNAKVGKSFDEALSSRLLQCCLISRKFEVGVLIDEQGTQTNWLFEGSC